MAINLSTKSAQELTLKTALENSVIAGSFTDGFNFTGAKTIEIITPVSQPLNDYKRSGSNRYGNAEELQDIKQTLVLSQDKSYAITVDKGNFRDQNYLKKIEKVIKMQQAERVIPTYDKYCLDKIAHKAGKINSNTTAPTKATICDRISAGTEWLDNHEVSSEGRTLFISATNYKLLRLSDEFDKSDALITKSLTKGVVGTYDNMKVVKVPASRMPKGVNFIIAQKNSWTAPKVISEAKVHKDPPGISGNLLEGRDYFDCFVIGARCNGIYADVSEAATTAPTVQENGTVGTVGGATVYYTTDGSDPRYSSTVKTGTLGAQEAGTVVSAYAEKEGGWASDVVTVVATA